MRIAIIGAGGGLGRAVVTAALADGHDVIALVRDLARAGLPAAVTVVIGDAARADDVARASRDTALTMWCVNPPFATWMTAFPPLLDAALAAVRTTGSRLVFPANVWIYGRGRAGERVGEERAPAPCSRRGRLRAELEARIRAAEIRWAIVRLPEFYGPHVVSVPTLAVTAAVADRRTWWPGALDVDVELVYMPDGARAMLAVGAGIDAAEPGLDVHVPGVVTTVRGFAGEVYRAAGARPRVTRVPSAVLWAAGAVNATARGAADIGHLWTDPIILDGARYRTRFGPVPCTDLATAVAATVAWHRDRGRPG